MPGPKEFPVALPDTEDGQQDVLRRLRQWRDVPMEGLRDIQLGQRCEFTYEHRLNPFKHDVHPDYTEPQSRCGPPPDECKHFSWEPPPRPLPAIFRAGTSRHIRVTEALHVRKGRNSQVFAGVLGDPHGDGLSTPVAVKIYRASWMKERYWMHLERAPVPGEHVCIAMNNFKREYWAYKKLASLQGTVIPHVYGFFKFQFHDEPCIALVMELIDAYNGEEYIALVGRENSNALSAFCDGLAIAAHAVQACGLSMHDFAARNILLPKDSPTFPVLVDFADAGDVNEMVLQLFPGRVKWVAIRIGFDEEKVDEWLRLSQDTPAYIEMFDLPPLELRTAMPNFRLVRVSDIPRIQ